MKQVIHVNQHIIRSNSKTGERNPVLTVKTYKSNDYAKQVDIMGDDGNVLASVVYSPDKPLSCGAKVCIETQQPLSLS